MTRLIDADALFINLDGMMEVSPTGYIHGDTVADMISDAPTIDTEPHWTPCSERLPEDDRSKVVTLANGNAEVGYYSNGDWWCVGDKVTLENQTVIAWMPLPKPYEVEQ
jgi:hypothetical protein